EIRRIRTRLTDEGHVGLHADATLRDLRWPEKSAAEVGVIGEERFDVQVTQHWMLDPRFNALDDLLRVDVANHAIGLTRWRLLCRAPRHDLIRDALDLARAHRGVVGESALQKSPWGDPDLH